MNTKEMFVASLLPPTVHTSSGNTAKAELKVKGPSRQWQRHRDEDTDPCGLEQGHCLITDIWCKYACVDLDHIFVFNTSY